MNKILLSLLLAGGVQNSFAMQGGGAAQFGAVSSSETDTMPCSLTDHEKLLIKSAEAGNLANVTLLLQMGVNASAKDVNGWNSGCTALMAAAGRGSIDIVNLLRTYNQGTGLEERDNLGKTALMYAAMAGHRNVVLQLIIFGANVNATDYNGKTALIWAAELGHTKTAQTLLKSGSARFNVQDNEGFTPLMMASLNGHIEIVKLLVACGANVNAINNYEHTAISLAATQGHANIVNLLSQNGAR